MGDCPYCGGTGVIYDPVNDSGTVSSTDDAETVCEGCGGSGDASW